MNYHTLTDWPALWEIARERQIKDPASCRVMCGGCGVELSAEGLIHWPDCDGARVLFLKQDPIDGKWDEVGNPSSGRDFPAAGPIAFAG